MEALQQGVSATVGVIALVAAALIWTVGNKHTPRLVVLLVMTGVAGLLGSQLGGWLRDGIGWADHTVGEAIGRLTGVIVLGLIAIVATYMLVMRVRARHIDNRTLGVAAVVPVAVSTIPGPAGAVAFGVITAITGAVGWAIGSLFGLT